MRISDWSSDVCSSDLLPQKPSQTGDEPDFAQQIDISAIERDAVETQASLCNGRCRQLIVAPRGLPQGRSNMNLVASFAGCSTELQAMGHTKGRIRGDQQNPPTNPALVVSGRSNGRRQVA